LFVPEFLAANDLLAKNNTILTGVAAAGNDVIPSADTLMDIIVGEPSALLAEINLLLLPQLPGRWSTRFLVAEKLGPGGEQQLIHFFHSAWLTGSMQDPGSRRSRRRRKHEWLDVLHESQFGSRYSRQQQVAPFCPCAFLPGKGKGTVPHHKNWLVNWIT